MNILIQMDDNPTEFPSLFLKKKKKKCDIIKENQWKYDIINNSSFITTIINTCICKYRKAKTAVKRQIPLNPSNERIRSLRKLYFT